METKNVKKNVMVSNPYFFIGTLILISFIILVIKLIM